MFVGNNQNGGNVIGYTNCDGEFYLISLMTDLVEEQTDEDSEDRKDMYELRDAVRDDSTFYNVRELKNVALDVFEKYCADIFNFDKAYLILYKVIEPVIRRNGGTFDEIDIINRILNREGWPSYTKDEKSLCRIFISAMFAKYVLMMRG